MGDRLCERCGLPAGWWGKWIRPGGAMGNMGVREGLVMKEALCSGCVAEALESEDPPRDVWLTSAERSRRQRRQAAQRREEREQYLRDQMQMPGIS